MSNSFSCVAIVGRDAEVMRLPTGQSVLTVVAANNVGYNENKKTLWLKISLWGKRAESNLVDYLKKGTQIYVAGQLTQSEYKTQNNETKYSNEINATILEVIGNRQTQPAQQTAQQPKPQQQKNTSGVGMTPPNVDDDFSDDIPFN